MPRRSSRHIGASDDPAEGRASTSSDPPRLRTKVGVARPPRRAVRATPSTTGRQRPTASERRRKVQHDPLPESSSDDDASEDEAGPSRPRMAPAGEDSSSDDQAQPSSPIPPASGDGPIPGGPSDLSVLVSFRTHVAISIWDGEVYVNSLYVLSNFFFK